MLYLLTRCEGNRELLTKYFAQTFKLKYSPHLAKKDFLFQYRVMFCLKYRLMAPFHRVITREIFSEMWVNLFRIFKRENHLFTFPAGKTRETFLLSHSLSKVNEIGLKQISAAARNRFLFYIKRLSRQTTLIFLDEHILYLCVFRRIANGSQLSAQ